MKTDMPPDGGDIIHHTLDIGKQNIQVSYVGGKSRRKRKSKGRKTNKRMGVKKSHKRKHNKTSRKRHKSRKHRYHR